MPLGLDLPIGATYGAGSVVLVDGAKMLQVPLWRSYLTGCILLGVGKLPVPWEALVLSIAVYVTLPLIAGYVSRQWLIRAKGQPWFQEHFLPVLTPITITALLITLVLLFSFKGEVILANPLTILWIAIPLFLQTTLIFGLGYGRRAFGVSPMATPLRRR
jgi:arsenite transporter